MIIAVDFDGTLCKSKFPEIIRPNLKLISMLKKNKANGDKLILWTCREGKLLEDAVNYCKQYGLEFDATNSNIFETIEKYGDSRKIHADLYIDDKLVKPYW